MLQRAASNAYSWWWASNIRTKQSKWLDSNLQEMEEKVRKMVKLIEVDADSFAKKAEMYFQRRPELLNFVEETYRSYKALADRYDRISGELHKANHTLASAFPDQFQFAMQDEDEDGSPRAFTAIDTSKIRKTSPAEVPRINLKNKSRDASSALKKHHKKASSHITKESAQNEVDRLQKEILVLQTEKEFVKSSYEGGLAKFWEIESQITDLQDEVCSLHDEFSASSIIEDDEARELMAATAIKSCEESLVSLQQHQKKSGEEARIESKRIREAKNKIMVLKGEDCSAEMENFDNAVNKRDKETFGLKNTGLDLYSICLQVKQHFQMNSDSSVVDLAERIDELVEKVFSLEVTVSSQNAQIQTLRLETDELQKHLRDLEEDKSNFIIDSNSLNVRVRKAEVELHRIQDIEKIMNLEKAIIQTHFAEACNSLNDISDKLQSPRCEEKDYSSASSITENFEDKEVEEKNAEGMQEGENHVKLKVEHNAEDTNDISDKLQSPRCEEKDYSSASSNTENFEDKEVEEKNAEEGSDETQEGEVHVKQKVEPNAEDINDQSHSNVASSQLANTSEKSNGDQLVRMVSSVLKDAELDDKGDIPGWQQLLNNGPEGRQKMLLYEYTSILRNYKETKKRLTEMEKKNQEYHFEMMAQIQELKSANAVKDQEIRALRRKLFSHTTSKDAATSQKEENGSSNQVFTAKSHYLTEIISAEEILKLCHFDQNHSTSPAEEKFRAELDTLLEENLDFWLRFSTSYHLIQKFKSSFKELQAGLEKLKESKEGGSAPASPKHPSKQETTPLDKKLRELHTELQVWLEQNGLLKGELQCRFTSLCNIQEEISKASRDNDGEDSKFTPYQAAKFQGELLNMQQENNKVAKELQTGLDHVKALQSEVAKALSKLRESFDISGSNGNNQYHNFRQLSTKSKVPLRTFLFGEKKKKASIFSCMSPALHRHHGHMKPGFPT